MLQYRYRSSTGETMRQRQKKRKGAVNGASSFLAPTHGTPSLYISTDDRTADGFRCYKNQLL